MDNALDDAAFGIQPCTSAIAMKHGWTCYGSEFHLPQTMPHLPASMLQIPGELPR